MWVDWARNGPVAEVVGSLRLKEKGLEEERWSENKVACEGPGNCFKDQLD